jgi:hypothetical protein
MKFVYKVNGRRLVHPSIHIEPDGYTLISYKSNTNLVAIANFPLQPNTGYYYWEVILHKCTSSNVMIGIARDAKTFDLQTYLGSNTNSYAYYGAGVLVGDSQKNLYLEEFHQNDIIGVVYDSDQLQIGFCKNGHFFGWCFGEDALKSSCLSNTFYPAVNLFCRGDKLQLLPKAGMKKGIDFFHSTLKI